MVIVKMNNTTVECSIAASELREIGLTPEAIVNGEKKSVPFMAQLNREVGEQLGYNPETEVLMMSKNMMMDGSVRIFAIKMSNEDIQKSADRIRGSAEAILREMTQERVNAIKEKAGVEKGQALNEMISHVSELIEQIYDQDEMEEPQIEAMAKPLVNKEKQLTDIPGTTENLEAHLAAIDEQLRNPGLSDDDINRLLDERTSIMKELEI